MVNPTPPHHNLTPLVANYFLIALLAAYFITEYLPEKAAKPLFVIAFLVNSGIHILRMVQSWGINEIDASILSMQLTIKVTYAAYALADFHAKSNRPDQIHRLPTIFEWFGYNFGFLGILGPATNLKDYLLFVDKKDNYSDIKSTFKKHIKQVLLFLLFAGVYLVGLIFDITESPFPDTERVKNWGFFMKMFMLNVSAITIRSQYVVVWLLG